MGLLTLIASFVVAISFLLAPCASDQLNLHKSIQQQEFAQPSLPRKLTNLNHETVKSSAEEDSMELHKFRQASSGTKQHGKEENMMNAAEKEGPNKSEYFTMDYGWVKRRRPIQNKQIPSSIP